MEMTLFVFLKNNFKKFKKNPLTTPDHHFLFKLDIYFNHNAVAEHYKVERERKMLLLAV